MGQEQRSVEDLEDLVDELLKANPQEEVLRMKMKNTGIPYSTDPIERINLVLRALHFEESAQDKKGKK